MQSVNSFGDMIKQFINGNGLYVLVCIIALSIILNLKNKNRKVVVLTILILVIVVLNPISFQILSKRDEFLAGYYRLLWIIPYGLILAYGMGEILDKVQKKVRVFVVFFSCMIIFYIYVPKEDLRLPDNKYQIPDETIYVADELERLRVENDKEQVRVFIDEKLGNTIRQYNAKICLCVDINRVDEFTDDYNDYNNFGLYYMLVNNRTDIPPEKVISIAQNYITDYLVISDDNQNVMVYLLQNGWLSVGKTPQYTILEIEE